MLRDEFPGHFVGHVVAFGIAAIAINGFVGRLAEGLRRREAAEKEALVQRAITERLAALGSLAAGVVHELGTPLGAIQLLVEECREGIDNRDAIEAQLGRCRTLLERLRTGESQTGISTPMDLDAWVAEWRRAHPGIEVACGEAVASPLVVGSEDGWRAALWTLLDNAVRARARRVQVALRIGEDVEVSVEDDGEGLAPGMETHAGEPFRSGWGGTGLGLHVARSFARSVGGDVLLETRPGSGARAILKMRRGKS
jgi:two-component system sensor histidine kinase RegB